MSWPRAALCAVAIAGIGGPTAAAGKIYWTENYCSEVCFSTIQRSNLDGSSAAPMTPVRLAGLGGLALDPVHDHVYWSQYGPVTAIERGDDTGCQIVTPVDYPGKMEIDPVRGKLYLHMGSIDRMNLDGSAREVVFQAGQNLALRSFTLDAVGGKLYVAHEVSFDDPTDRISRVDLDGGGTVVIHSGPPICGIAVDPVAGKIYWKEDFPPFLRRANVDGSEPEDVPIPEVGCSFAIDANAGKIYWATYGAIERANLDGSNRETIASANGNVSQLALDPADETDVKFIPCAVIEVPALGWSGGLTLGLLALAGSALLHRRKPS